MSGEHRPGEAHTETVKGLPGRESGFAGVYQLDAVSMSCFFFLNLEAAGAGLKIHILCHLIDDTM